MKAELEKKIEATKTLEEEQNRLLKLIPSGLQEQANEWRNDLANAEKELRTIRRVEIPKLNSDLEEARNALQQLLKGLQFTWNNEADADQNDS